MSSEISLNEAAARLRSADNILILTHNRPDGDTVGSAAGLCVLLRQLDKTAYVIPNPDTGKKLLPFVKPYFAPDGFTPDFVVAVDVASEVMFFDGEKPYVGRVDLCIDHHGTNDSYAKERHVEPASAACAEIIVRLAEPLGASLTAASATPLYLGVATDTGCFRYSSVNSDTHAAAAQLLGCNIDSYTINRDFFEVKTRAAMAVESAVTSAAQFYRGGSVAVSYLPLSVINDAHATDDDTPNLASVLRTIEGVQLGVLVRESEDGSFRLSARSSPDVDCAAICAHVGGGGHKAAAGATLRMGREAAMEAVLDAIRAELGEL